MNSDSRTSGSFASFFYVTPFQRCSASFSQLILLINAAQERKEFGERCQGINCGRKTEDGTIESKLQIAI
jgi:hypothetical protein